MEIKNKEAYRAELKKVLTERIRQFPVFFWGNIILNISIIVAIILAALVVIFSFRLQLGAEVYSFFAIGSLLGIFPITLRKFWKNVSILNAIHVGHYDLKIEDYELDNVIEFLEDLPIKKEELERMKVTLSFGKLINVLDLLGIITHSEDMCDIDIIFKYRTAETIREDILK